MRALPLLYSIVFLYRGNRAGRNRAHALWWDDFLTNGALFVKRIHVLLCALIFLCFAPETLWSVYHLEQHAAQPTAQHQLPAEGAYTLLVVEGWRTAAAVQSFDAALRSWETALDDADLVEMIVKPDSLRVYWQLRISSRSELERSLRNYLEPRGLSFSFLSR
jgi:hypothetical protein